MCQENMNMTKKNLIINKKILSFLNFIFIVKINEDLFPTGKQYQTEEPLKILLGELAKNTSGGLC